MAKNSPAKIAAIHRYTAKAYDRIDFMVPKGQREVIKQYAASRGESTNGFIWRVVRSAMEQDGKG